MNSSLKKLYFSFFVAVLIGVSIGFSGCNDEIYSTNPKDKLSFSKDTLAFDTVFATIGTATSKVMIYNRNNTALKISHIALARGKSSEFKINVDGSLNANGQFDNIEIRAKDSLFIFVSVTVNPLSENSPVFIKDSIVFQTNGVFQNVKLQAYGQNIIPLKNKLFKDDTTLNANLPYVVTGNLVIDSAKTLTLTPGCRLYFHNNANLIVYGTLKANGTAADPITLRGDRLDDIKFATPFPYNDVAGQWGGVYLLWNRAKHELHHVNMNSGYVGIYLSNNDRNTLPNLEITDCRIQNFLLYGLVVQNGNIQVSNSEISNTSSYTVYLNGGKHTFLQSTIVNYFSQSNVEPTDRTKDQPTVMIMNLNRVAPMETVFRNCIISGNFENEFTLATRSADLYPGVFDHCYIRKTDSLKLAQFTNIRWFNVKDTLFKSNRYDYIKHINFNFMPDSISPVRGKADLTIASQFPLDLNGNNRLVGNKPDLGCYQWQPIKK